MTVLEQSMKDPNSLADSKFIEAALSEVESEIVYIEQRHNVTLAGDRADFARARSDWRRMTKSQVAYAVSLWTAEIFKRYSGMR